MLGVHTVAADWLKLRVVMQSLLAAAEQPRYTARVNPVKELMNLQHLQWTKNVKPANGWAYSDFKASELFKLAWKDDEANANKPERNDLILLRQHGYVTHLVKVLNRQAEREDWLGDYIEELPTFKDAWDSQGGLSAFQEHVKSKLASV